MARQTLEPRTNSKLTKKKEVPKKVSETGLPFRWINGQERRPSVTTASKNDTASSFSSCRTDRTYLWKNRCLSMCWLWCPPIISQTNSQVLGYGIQKTTQSFVLRSFISISPQADLSGPSPWNIYPALGYRAPYKPSNYNILAGCHFIREL